MLRLVASLTAGVKSHGVGVHGSFQVRGGKFERVQDVESQLQLRSVSESQVRSWFGVAKGFHEVGQLTSFAVNGTPSDVNSFGDTDITAALTYSNHSSVLPYSADIINRVQEDVRFGRAFVFPLRVVNDIMGLRLSPLKVEASSSNPRVMHDLTLASSSSSPDVNAGMNFSAVPPCQLGHVMRAVVLPIWYVRRKYGVGARIVLSKMDVKDAIRHLKPNELF